MGPSGSGKSTLLACMSGILKPHHGKVIWNDKSIYELKDKELSQIHGKEISYVSQSNIFLKEYTINENILLPYNIDIRNKEWLEKAKSILEKFRINQLGNNYPEQLSGGELKRASIARAILMSPKVIIADEPTTGLDKETADIILDYLDKLAQKEKIVIIATHDENVKKYCNNVYNIEKGKVIRKTYHER